MFLMYILCFGNIYILFCLYAKTLLARYLHNACGALHIAMHNGILVDWKEVEKSLITKIAINKYTVLWSKTGMNHKMIINISG